LRGVSFRIDKGELVSLWGPSGCGKSTLLNILGTLDGVTSGELSLMGKPVDTLRPFNLFRANNIGFVFQFHHLLPNLTLLENVEIPMHALKVPKHERLYRARQILSDMGLTHRLNFYPTKVSGGERQRAAIARAMVNNPKIILADEPTGNLDTVTGEKIVALLTGFCRENRITLLVATHNPDVSNATDRMIRMTNGQIQPEPQNRDS
jgi:putative ABC transport system ATP-binding protein